jgi:hypothetical protein
VVPVAHRIDAGNGPGAGGRAMSPFAAVSPSPHPEERSAAERLEGWQQARFALPPFETLAALAPQGEVSSWRKP